MEILLFMMRFCDISEYSSKAWGFYCLFSWILCSWRLTGLCLFKVANLVNSWTKPHNFQLICWTYSKVIGHLNRYSLVNGRKVSVHHVRPFELKAFAQEDSVKSLRSRGLDQKWWWSWAITVKDLVTVCGISRRVLCWKGETLRLKRYLILSRKHQ